MRVLFVLKYRAQSGDSGSWCYSDNGGVLSSGLSISVTQVQIMLSKMGIECKVVHVVDGNAIHKEVVAYKPTHVVIESFWVVPTKFTELQAQKNCAGIHWIVRCHSNTEFLAHEGVVFGWALEYQRRGVTVAFNSKAAERTIRALVLAEGLVPRTAYLPNYYDFDYKKPRLLCWLAAEFLFKKPVLKEKGVLNIGCFGAIRPLKNHMNQALASILFARYLGLKLRFHVNVSRIENQGDALLRSLKSLFENKSDCTLVAVPWMDHAVFLDYQKREIDMVTQVSMSETFNIVSADAVAMEIPVVGSNIPWLDSRFQADPIDVQRIVRVMYRTWYYSGTNMIRYMQQAGLARYSKRSQREWLSTLNSLN